MKEIGKIILIGGKIRNAKTISSLILNTSIKNWKSAFHKLSLLSRAIIMIPEDSNGVLDEIQYIQKNNLWFKTIIYVAPTVRTEDHPNYRENAYKRVSDNLKKYGINLPTYDPIGYVYLANKDFSLRKAVSLKGYASSRNIKKAFDILLSNLPVEVIPLKEAIDDILSLEK